MKQHSVPAVNLFHNQAINKAKDWRKRNASKVTHVFGFATSTSRADSETKQGKDYGMRSDH